MENCSATLEILNRMGTLMSGKYCNVDGQSGVFTVQCSAEPSRAGPGRAGPRHVGCYTALR
jgi:hypothetical protein